MCLWISCTWHNPIIAQKAQLTKANTYFDAGNYDQALKAFNDYSKTYKKADLLIKRGICYFETNQPHLCIRDMAAAHNLKSKNPDRFKYTAESYFSQGNYTEAATFYKNYLALINDNHIDWFYCIDQIKRCGYAKKLSYLPQLVFVENLGPNVNTTYDEFSPKQSPTNLNRYYFSSARQESIGGRRNSEGFEDLLRGKYSADIYYIDLVDGNWKTVFPLSGLINGPKHEIIQDFSTNGSVMYYLQSSNMKTGILLTDTFNLEREPYLFSEQVTELPFDPQLGDKDLQFFNDSLIVFSSIQEGGQGGYDLYYSVKSGDEWSPAINLGSNVNSSFNEVSPFLLRDGKTLYFSSDKIEGLGGYDIYSTNFENLTWSEPINQGAPLNSPGDDFGFRVSSDGLTGIFNSNRTSSIGGHDLYFSYFKEQILGQFMSVDIPEFVTSHLIEKDTSEVDDFVIEPDNFKLNPAKELLVNSLFFKDDNDILNTNNTIVLKRLSDFLCIYPDTKVLLQSHYISEGQKETDIFYSLKRVEKVADFLAKNGIKRSNIIIQGMGASFPAAINDKLGNNFSYSESINKRIDITIVPGPKSNIKVNYNFPVIPIEQKGSEWDRLLWTKDTVSFRVEFAKTTQMLRGELIHQLSDIIIEKHGTDNQYFYTSGNFTNLDDAIFFQNRLQRQNLFNAKVFPYYKGLRMTINELQNLGIKSTQLDKFIQSFGE